MVLLTLAEAKAQLNITSSDHDAELQAYIAAAVYVIEAIVGPVESRTVTETVEGEGRMLTLSQIPVISLTSLTAILTGGVSYAAGELHVDQAAGVVRRLDGLPFRGGPWTATYTAGYPDVPANINLAARIIVQHLWRTQYGSSLALPAIGGADDYAVTEPIPGLGYAIPNRALELLELHRRLPGVG